MVKKKTKQRRAQEEPLNPMSVQVSPKVDYVQPLSSPYEGPVVTATIGNKQYCILGYCLRKCPQFEQQSVLSSYITLPYIHEDVGHTFVHFLYSGCYETIDSPVDDGISSAMREYRRSVLIYQASRTYQLPSLEALARDYIERFGEEMSISDILRTTSEVFSNLPEDETWLPKYIERNLRHSLRSSKSKFDVDELYKAFGQDHYFDNTVTRMMLEILLRPQGVHLAGREERLRTDTHSWEHGGEGIDWKSTGRDSWRATVDRSVD
ncbi:hypothetical protein N7539_009361 [Penicillium diatomitis]|uniref:BTB domain-containing protein n=1 Tax=Penicillium diatomitis TaxID=2819901 RepID=A0A9W9WMB4_9EURO|nr:uncharacterized protein N7539_009361 [Penicillium diatomitis]KAJ5469743.1 hypothetical protein N7539_009361 [Penicillium diatomitis]